MHTWGAKKNTHTHIYVHGVVKHIYIYSRETFLRMCAARIGRHICQETGVLFETLPCCSTNESPSSSPYTLDRKDSRSRYFLLLFSSRLMSRSPFLGYFSTSLSISSSLNFASLWYIHCCCRSFFSPFDLLPLLHIYLLTLYMQFLYICVQYMPKRGRHIHTCHICLGR